VEVNKGREDVDSDQEDVDNDQKDVDSDQEDINNDQEDVDNEQEDYDNDREEDDHKDDEKIKIKLLDPTRIWIRIQNTAPYYLIFLSLPLPFLYFLSSHFIAFHFTLPNPFYPILSSHSSLAFISSLHSSVSSLPLCPFLSFPWIPVLRFQFFYSPSRLLLLLFLLFTYSPTFTNPTLSLFSSIPSPSFSFHVPLCLSNCPYLPSIPFYSSHLIFLPIYISFLYLFLNLFYQYLIFLPALLFHSSSSPNHYVIPFLLHSK